MRFGGSNTGTQYGGYTFGINQAAVAITGGAIDGVVIGGVTPAAITGTVITANTNVVAPTGSSATPSFKFAGEVTGIYRGAAGAISFVTTTTPSFHFNGSELRVLSGCIFGITSSASDAVGTASDTRLGRGSAGVWKFMDANSMAANGVVATTMTSLGPVGSHTTIQEWLTIQNPSGTVRWIPCY